MNNFRVGGPADYFCVVKNEAELKEAINFTAEKKCPYFILGGGSNVLISDEGFRGLVIKIDLDNIEIGGQKAVVGAGVSLAALLKKTMAGGFGDLSWATGIPGTVGGAVFGNCGAYGGQMADHIVTVSVLRNNQIINVDKGDCGFDYRQSIFKKSNDIILSVELKLAQDDMETARNKIKEIMALRKNKIPAGFNAGSIFKNVAVSAEEMKLIKKRCADLPEKFIQDKMIPAGWLIDQCGLKGRVIGDAEISQIHAGIIVNRGQAKAADVWELIKLAKAEVKKKFGLLLEEEIRLIGFESLRIFY